MKKSVSFIQILLGILTALCIMTFTVSAQVSAHESGDDGDYSEFLAEILAEINAQYTVKDILFFGDSRVVGMSGVGGEGYHYVGKVSAGYSWMTGDGYTKFSALMEEYPEAAVVFCFGVNDMGNIESYISWYQNFMEEHPDRIIKLLSVNPIEDDKAGAAGYKAKDSSVADFNARLSEAFPEEYLDCYDYLLYTGLASADGVHYSNETYWKIQEYVKEQIG